MTREKTSTVDQRYSDIFGARRREAEYDRLSAITEALDAATQRRLSALRPRSNWRCLELGAGTGTIAHWLSRTCPAGRVVATDVDLRFLTGLSGQNLEVMRHDVTADDFPAGAFDLIHARWLFVHLPERQRVLDRAVSWLAPGGLLIIEEPAAFPLESSHYPEYRDVFLAHIEVLNERVGTDVTWPRLFPQPLLLAGLEAVDMEISVSVVGGGRPMGRVFAQVIAQTAPEMIDTGRATQAQVDRFVELMYCDDFCDLNLATIAAWGRRPAE
jgi:SAM-dependent methyltransferase